ncbi:hypothetical protein E3N88_13803 [Mikania micrantha]|uniref:CCHC-type domain-containing protein n=1 Tax=Mikania micrantha TaxID=192012 RepID=A0A5N6P1N6_9ASTR|nr:hypothetical protein E3N88_13803 [Mikania micrantha]
MPQKQGKTAKWARTSLTGGANPNSTSRTHLSEADVIRITRAQLTNILHEPLNPFHQNVPIIEEGTAGPNTRHDNPNTPIGNINNSTQKCKYCGADQKSVSQENNVTTLVVRNDEIINQDKQGYKGRWPKCNQCSFHHTGLCPECERCGQVGHYTRYCHEPAQQIMLVPQRTQAGRTYFRLEQDSYQIIINLKETAFIKEVVADIHRRLHVPLSHTLPRLIGMAYEIEFISSWLTDGSCHTLDTLTVVGMSGIGKTSLARHVFGLHFSKFDKSSFIEDINAKANERSNGLLDLQKQLHGDISKKIELRVNDVNRYTSKIEYVLARKTVFIVLDDIGSLKQLDALLGNKGLHPGSKVIITTNDVSLTKGYALFKSQVHPNHKEVLLNGLYEYESLELLCFHAFNSHNPKEGYEEVSEKLVKYCDGHPLAIEVLGSSLQNQDVAYWEECIKVLKKEPHSHINKALKMSFDTLVFENDKELFKHIACFFVGIDRDVTEKILNSCDLNARYGITNLINRCLLSIGWNNELMMHQLVRETGRDLVRQESPKKPWKCSRSWCHMDSFKVLKHKKGKGNMLGLALDMRMLDKKKLHGSFKLKAESFNHMDNLMLLQLNYVQLHGCFKNFSEELRWLCMHGCPLKSIPLDLPMENLVALDISYSYIESFDVSYSNPQPVANMQTGLIGSNSKDKRLLGSLKILDLSFCEQLHSVGGFFLLPALERLILGHCTFLINVCESIDKCDELVHIDLSYCYKLKKLPKSLGNLTKVKTLLLDGCDSCESQIEMRNVNAIPNDLKFFMISLPSSLRILSLANNNLYNECFPMDLSCLAMLEELCLDNNPIVSMPSCVRTLPRLERLYMDDCYKVISIEHPPRMASVEEKVLHSLGWTNLEFAKEMVLKTFRYGGRSTECQTQCGICLKHADDDDDNDEEEDVLGYYKSWNHIIGGDLSPFETTTGEYILHHNQFWRLSTKIFGFSPFIDDGTKFKDFAFHLQQKEISRESDVVGCSMLQATSQGWNTDAWKKKSERGRNNRTTADEEDVISRHTGMYGEDVTQHMVGDAELWERTQGGSKFGIGSLDSNVIITGTPSSSFMSTPSDTKYQRSQEKGRGTTSHEVRNATTNKERDEERDEPQIAELMKKFGNPSNLT